MEIFIMSAYGETNMKHFDTALYVTEESQSTQTTQSAFEKHQHDRLRRCYGAVHGIAQLLERDGIEKDSGGDGVLDAFTMGGLSHALTIVSLCAEDSLDALESRATKPPLLAS
jgi:hypothetical protein